MYNVSSAYLTAARANTKTDNIYGTITFSDGTTENLTESSFKQGSISITRQAVEDDELNFGAAVIGELDLSLRTNTDRYAFYGARISLTYQLKVGGTTASPVWEDVPLGTYTVDESSRVGSVVSLVCYDDMAKFDIDIGSAVYYGTPQQILNSLCLAVGLQLGTQPATISAYPNATELIQIDPDSGCKTLRNALKSVCQMIGCFAEVGRDGKLYVRQFHSTADVTLSKGDRYSSSIADYQCQYVALQVTGIQGTFTAVTEIIRTGLTLVMDDAPAWDYGLTATLQTRADNLMEYLEDIMYTPSELEMPGDPAFDCGDRLKLTIEDADDYVETLITEYTWTYHNPMQISCVGTNPYLEGSKTSEATSNRILSQDNENNKVTIYTLTNDEDIEVADGATVEIGSCIFSAKKSTSALFIGFIQVDVTPETTSTTYNITTNATFYDENGNEVPVTGTLTLPAKECDVTIKYVLGQDLLSPIYTFTEHLSEGLHAIPLFYPLLTVQQSTIYYWHVLMTVEGGSVEIEQFDANGALFGQNLVASGDAWDGTIEAFETFAGIQLNMGAVVDSASTSFIVPTSRTPSDIFTAIRLNMGAIVEGTTEERGISFSLFAYTEYVSTTCETSDELGWIGEGDIGSGTEGIVDITMDVGTIGFTGIELHENAGAQFKVSFDNGTTWVGYNNGTWQNDYYMSGAVLTSISSAEWATHSSILLKVGIENLCSLREIYFIGGSLNA